jgi:hypothetical protein
MKLESLKNGKFAKQQLPTNALQHITGGIRTPSDTIRTGNTKTVSGVDANGKPYSYELSEFFAFSADDIDDVTGRVTFEDGHLFWM